MGPAAVNGPWHILTGEYPPMPGGVSDYTRVVARGLAAAGDSVTVWAPAGCDGSVRNQGVDIRRLPDHFGRRGRGELDRAIPAGARVLVQYVPHAFGARSMNVGLAAWLWRRRDRWAIDVMFHEVAMPIGGGQPWRYNIAAAVHRAMAGLLVRAAERVFISTEAWRPLVEPWMTSGRATLSPVFSNLPGARPERVAALRAGRAGAAVVGHFGSCGTWAAEFMERVMREVAREFPAVTFEFIGRGSARGGEAIRERLRAISSNVVVTGDLPAQDAADRVASCDLMLLPYPDGITTRRSSAMAALAAGVPVVSTAGHLSEPWWPRSGAVLLGRDPVACAAAVVSLLTSRTLRQQMSAAAARLYAEQFDVSHTVRRLRECGSTRADH